MIKALENFGLSKFDAKVYILLAKGGPQNEVDITKALKINKNRLKSSVKNLRNKGIIVATADDPVILCAFPFEKVLERLIRTEIENAKEIRKSREELFSHWSSIDLKDRKVKKP